MLVDYFGLEKRKDMFEIFNKLRKSRFYINFNQRNRDEWVKKIATKILDNSKLSNIRTDLFCYKILLLKMIKL